jgi:DeoR/GlpR family transcriptional regulator of sugar metabolism
MNSKERRQQIIELLEIKATVEIEELARRFDVSDMTIYRDLQKLEEEGYLRKTIGGAIRNIDFPVGGESSYSRRLKTNWEEKQALARKAVQYIEDGDSLGLDASTTTYALAREIQKLKVSDLTVITNLISAQLDLSRNQGISSISTGGLVRANSFSLVGPVAEKFLEAVNLDKSFLSAKAVSLEGDFMDPEISEARIKELLVKRSHEVTMLIDHSKFGKRALNTFATLKDIHRLIVDDQTSPQCLDRFREQGIQVEVVPVHMFSLGTINSA